MKRISDMLTAGLCRLCGK